jgi:hypothetical protein
MPALASRAAMSRASAPARARARIERREANAALVGEDVDHAELGALRIDGDRCGEHAILAEQRRAHLRRREPVLRGHVHAFAVVVFGQAMNRPLEVRHPRAQKDQPVRPARHRVADEALAIDRRFAPAAPHDEPEPAIAEKAFGANAKGHVPARIEQRSTEHRADRAGADDQRALFRVQHRRAVSRFAAPFGGAARNLAAAPRHSQAPLAPIRDVAAPVPVGRRRAGCVSQTPDSAIRAKARTSGR